MAARIAGGWGQWDKSVWPVRDTLNLNFVRTTEYVKPNNPAEQDLALLKAIVEEHGEPASLITTGTAETEYEGAGVFDRGEDGNLTGDGERFTSGPVQTFGNYIYAQ